MRLDLRMKLSILILLYHRIIDQWHTIWTKQNAICNGWLWSHWSHWSHFCFGGLSLNGPRKKHIGKDALKFQSTQNILTSLEMSRKHSYTLSSLSLKLLHLVQTSSKRGKLSGCSESQHLKSKYGTKKRGPKNRKKKNFLPPPNPRRSPNVLTAWEGLWFTWLPQGVIGTIYRAAIHHLGVSQQIGLVDPGVSLTEANDELVKMNFS